MRRIALVTCAELPEPDPDEQLLLDACCAAGIAAELAAWDDPAVEWSRFSHAVIRSSWNYYERPAAFRDWVDQAALQSKLWNGAKVVKWSMDKRYLVQMQALGVPIVPTAYPGGPDDLLRMVREAGWRRFVIKPVISAGSFLTRFFDASGLREAAEFATSFRGRAFMAQKFMESVEDGGEQNLVFIDGQLTHAVIKRPRFADDDESVSAAIEPSSSAAKLGQAVLAKVRDPLLYARVDVMRDDGGRWLLSELELIEPSLFFLQNPAALESFIGALASLP